MQNFFWHISRGPYASAPNARKVDDSDIRLFITFVGGAVQGSFQYLSPLMGVTPVVESNPYMIVVHATIMYGFDPTTLAQLNA